jgi:hypothetical protein
MGIRSQVIKRGKICLNQSLTYTIPFPPILTPIFYLHLFNSVDKNLLLGRKILGGSICPPCPPPTQVTPISSTPPMLRTHYKNKQTKPGNLQKVVLFRKTGRARYKIHPLVYWSLDASLIIFYSHALWAMIFSPPTLNLLKPSGNFTYHQV